MTGQDDHPGALMAGAALASFRLNGQFLALADELARPAGLTAAWWQVLGAVLHEPFLAEYRPNPAHSRAKLLAPTSEGLAAVERVMPDQRAFAARLADHLGTAELRRALTAMEQLSKALDDLDAG